jgi:hypothetical protein
MSFKPLARVALWVLLMVTIVLPAGVAGQEGAAGPLLPIGGGYSDIYAGFSAAAVANAQDGQVTILVLPTAYSSNPAPIPWPRRPRAWSARSTPYARRKAPAPCCWPAT